MKAVVLAWATLFYAASFALGQAAGGDDTIPVVLHVTAVKAETPKDVCTDGRCVAVKYTVEGNAHSIKLVLVCMEFRDLDPFLPQTVLTCPQVWAGSDYAARLGTDHLILDDQHPPEVQWFRVVSQREVDKP